MKTYVEYSLEAPWGYTTNEYHNIYFYGEIKKKNWPFLKKKKKFTSVV